jgi:hypothetical protein
MTHEKYNPNELFETDIMRTILAAAWRTSPQAVEGIAGVRIVTPYWERPEGEDCTGYVFGPGKNGKDETEDLMATGQQNAAPVPGAIAVYLHDGKYPTHVGSVIGNGNVLSKWTTDLFESGHVYEHAPLAVPSDYGNTVVFYSRK